MVEIFFIHILFIECFIQANTLSLIHRYDSNGSESVSLSEEIYIPLLSKCNIVQSNGIQAIVICFYSQFSIDITKLV